MDGWMYLHGSQTISYKGVYFSTTKYFWQKALNSPWMDVSSLAPASQSVRHTQKWTTFHDFSELQLCYSDLARSHILDTDFQPGRRSTESRRRQWWFPARWKTFPRQTKQRRRRWGSPGCSPLRCVSSTRPWWSPACSLGWTNRQTNTQRQWGHLEWCITAKRNVFTQAVKVCV